MELKPCPFCGQTDAVEVMQEADSFSVCHGSYRVICNTRNCGCGSSSGYHRTIERAVTAWNVRGLHPTIKAGVKCECGSTNTVCISGGGYQDSDASRGMPMLETNGQIACNDCGRTWWD